MSRSPKMLVLLLGSISLLAAGCGTFEVGVEPLTPSAPASEIPTPQLLTTPTETSQPNQEIFSTEMPHPEMPSLDIPDLVSLGHLAPFGSADIGLLVLDNGELTVQASPIEYGILWDYSPQTGKLAYSSEFFHQSKSNNLSVSDLWVYDYQTGTKEMWLMDNVTRAVWAPDGENVTAAVYNPNTEQVELVFISGPDRVDLIDECASMVFSWSPAGDKLAYVNGVAWKNFGVDEACLGTFLVTFPNGFSSAEREINRVSEFGTQEFAGLHLSDEPLWALEQNALIYPDAPFWIVPLDGSSAFIPQTPDNQDPLNLPRPFGNLWSSENIQLVGNVDSGPAGFGGVWIYQLSGDLTQIESFYRIGEVPTGENSFINLVDWWVPGESILVLNGDNPDTSQSLSDVWRGPAIWSLSEIGWANSSNE